MIERFNFYDLYGYLIPGVVLILTLGLPFVIASQAKVETSEWAILIIGVILAYIAGHVLQSIAKFAIPSAKDRKQNRPRFFSAAMLDPDDGMFTNALRERISDGVRSWFELEMEIETKGNEAIDAARQDAFFLCRRVVNESSNYAEQFEGLYTMMRGIAAALWLATPYTVGWAVGWSNALDLGIDLRLPLFAFSGFLILSTTMYFVAEAKLWMLQRVNIASLALLGLTLLFVGYLFARAIPKTDIVPIMVAAALAYVAMSFRFLNAYRFFAREFAKAVWLHFAAEPINRPNS